MEEPSAPVRLEEYRTSVRARSELTAWVGMVVFLASWAMLFASLFFAYALVRSHAPSWPPADQPVLPLALPALNTAALAISALAMERAMRSLRAGRARRAATALAAAAALGFVFLVLQGVVWLGLYRAGLEPSGGPYPSAFYTLTVFHALHVLVGLLALGWLAVRARGGAYGALRLLPVRLWAMYWHFVGAVWLAMFASLYLL